MHFMSIKNTKEKNIYAKLVILKIQKKKNLGKNVLCKVFVLRYHRNSEKYFLYYQLKHMLAIFRWLSSIIINSFS